MMRFVVLCLFSSLSLIYAQLFSNYFCRHHVYFPRTEYYIGGVFTIVRQSSVSRCDMGNWAAVSMALCNSAAVSSAIFQRNNYAKVRPDQMSNI